MTNEFDFNEEFEATPETAETHEIEAAETPERETFTLKDGSEGSRAAYIREIFLEDNLSRKAISEQYGFPYRVVYSATVNMVNDAEPAGRGRTASNVMIEVTGEEQALVRMDDDGKYYDAESGVSVYKKDVVEVNRNNWIRDQVNAGLGRSEVADMLDLSYGVVYNLTKDLEGVRAKHEVELEDGTVISRTDYIRQLYAEGEGKTRSEIAKELDVAYSVVWQATKVEKTEAQKFEELIEQVKDFEDKVTDAGAFEAAINALEAIQIAEPEA